MYADLRQEGDTAFQRVATRQQKRASDAALDLAKLGGVGVILGLAASVIDIGGKIGNLAGYFQLMAVALVPVAVWVMCGLMRMQSPPIRRGLCLAAWGGFWGVMVGLLWFALATAAP